VKIAVNGVTNEELNNRIDEFKCILRNYSDMPKDIYEMYKARIETLDVRLDIMKWVKK
jgi:hypothetical protein